MEEPQGTIYEAPDLDTKLAAERLKKAMRGIGSDERMIIKVLVSHSGIQRAAIEGKYKALYDGRDLVKDLKLELGGHFEDLVVAMLTPKYDLLVNAINDSFSFTGSNAQVLTEILCSRPSEDINSLCWRYENIFDETLESAITSNLSGDFGRLMFSLLNSERPPDDDEVDETEVANDAQKLYDAGIGFNADTEESTFIALFNGCSFSHLGRVFEAYQVLSDEPIEASVESEFGGRIKDGLLAIVKRVKDPYGFFAERLHKSMQGAGTDDRSLIRIIVSRSEEDLQNIKKRYQEMYGKSLADDVKDDTGGDYTKLLLAIINRTE